MHDNRKEQNPLDIRTAEDDFMGGYIAWNENTYDGGLSDRRPGLLGRGPTRAAARADLIERLAELEHPTPMKKPTTLEDRSEALRQELLRELKVAIMLRDWDMIRTLYDALAAHKGSTL